MADDIIPIPDEDDPASIAAGVALVPGRFAQKQIDSQVYASASGCGAIRCTQLWPAGSELSRAGARFAVGQSGTITGIPPVQTMPNTVAQWAFWNSSTTKSLVFEMLGAYTVNGVSAVGATIVCAHFALPASTTNRAGITVTSLSNSMATTNAIINASVGITSPAGAIWFMVARDNSPNTAAFRTMATNDRLGGSIIVPPRRGLGLNVLCPVGADFAPMAQWTEVALDLE